MYWYRIVYKVGGKSNRWMVKEYMEKNLKFFVVCDQVAYIERKSKHLPKQSNPIEILTVENFLKN